MLFGVYKIGGNKLCAHEKHSCKAFLISYILYFYLVKDAGFMAVPCCDF